MRDPRPSVHPRHLHPIAGPGEVALQLAGDPTKHGLDADAADDAFGMIAHWSAGWEGSATNIFDPWSTERRVLDELRVEVGTTQELWSLDTHPLPDEPFDRSVVPPAATEAVDEVLSHIDAVGAVLGDPELTTAARRLTARVVAGDPAVFVDQADRAVAAAVLVWLVGRANNAFGRGRARVMDVMACLGLRQASPAGWATPYLRAAGLRHHGHRGRITLGPDLLTSRHRQEIIELRDHCQRVIGDPPPAPDVLQIAHGTGRDPGAPAAGQRAPAPRRAR